MPSFGDRLRHERESRNTRIKDVADRTRIGIRYLEALENNDFEALPGPRGFGKLYIRAYSEMLGFDPRPLIDAFEKERRKQSRGEREETHGEPVRRRRIRYVPPPRKPADPEPTPRTPAEPEEAAEPEPVAVPEATAPDEPTAEPEVAAELTATTEPETIAAASMPAAGRKHPTSLRGWVVAAALFAVMMLVVAGVALRPRSTPSSSEVGPTDSTVARPQPETTAADRHVLETVETRTPPPQEDRAAAAEEGGQEQNPPEPVRKADIVTPSGVAIPGRLSVTESGVGTGVVDRRLIGPGSRFDEGSVVYFFNRVVGAVPGQKIRHVWLREGRVIQSIELTLGSAHWRTYTNKTLWGRGNWAVEARGADDSVLARADFVCDVP